MHQLNPELNKQKWEVEDTKRLFELQQSGKNKWKRIAEAFPGRTDNSIKNQFFSVVRKALRKACKILGNISNTDAINQIKPKVLSNYMSMAVEIPAEDGSGNTEMMPLNPFVQKYAFTRLNDLARNVTDRELVIIDKCISFLNEQNEGYNEKKRALKGEAEQQQAPDTQLPTTVGTEQKLDHEGAEDEPSDFVKEPGVEIFPRKSKCLNDDKTGEPNLEPKTELEMLDESIEVPSTMATADNEKLSSCFHQIKNKLSSVIRLLKEKEEREKRIDFNLCEIVKRFDTLLQYTAPKPKSPLRLSNYVIATEVHNSAYKKSNTEAKSVSQAISSEPELPIRLPVQRPQPIIAEPKSECPSLSAQSRKPVKNDETNLTINLPPMSICIPPVLDKRSLDAFLKCGAVEGYTKLVSFSNYRAEPSDILSGNKRNTGPVQASK